MGKVTLYFRDESREVHKCKSSSRARDLKAKRPTCNDFYYSDLGNAAPRPIKKRNKMMHEMTLEEMEQYVKRNDLLINPFR